MKSIMGYGLAAIIAYIIWVCIARWLDSKSKQSSHDRSWRIAQWCSTGLLWHMWLAHDMANICVFLPRQIDGFTISVIIVIFVAGLAYIFKEKGGKIQDIIIEKHNTRYVRSATIVDLVYAFILFYFKMYNDIPMSTTFCFIGLLCGREMGIATMLHDYKFKKVWPLIGRDFLKITFGVIISIALAITIHEING